MQNWSEIVKVRCNFFDTFSGHFFVKEKNLDTFSTFFWDTEWSEMVREAVQQQANKDKSRPSYEILRSRPRKMPGW